MNPLNKKDEKMCSKTCHGKPPRPLEGERSWEDNVTVNIVDLVQKKTLVLECWTLGLATKQKHSFRSKWADLSHCI